MGEAGTTHKTNNKVLIYLFKKTRHTDFKNIKLFK